MLGEIRTINFEHGALGVLALSIVILYGLALGGVRLGPVEPGAAALRPPSDTLPGIESPIGEAAVLAARWLVKPTVDVATLDELYERVDYRLDGVRRGIVEVPRILVEKIPDDLATVESPDERKRLFIQLTLPLILFVNEHIRGEREHLLALRNQFGSVAKVSDADERRWLEELARRYRLEEPRFDKLLRRVDIIPPSLALAQGAEESGWGTSRFVREGNAIFGQRTYVAGDGLVPLARSGDKSFEVKSFNQLIESVASYMMNLNTHPAYREFRGRRAEQRNNGNRLDPYALAGTLERYSERGADYVDTIHTLMRANQLEAFDKARLGDERLALLDPAV